MKLTTKINKLEKELTELKKQVQKKDYEPVICNGLMWSEITDDEMDWEEAMEYAKNLREGGYKDWRLPTVSELQNIFDYEKGKPKIDFGDTSYFWSSTEYSFSVTRAWYVLLGHGYTSYCLKTGSGVVRCVREDKG